LGTERELQQDSLVQPFLLARDFAIGQHDRVQLPRDGLTLFDGQVFPKQPAGLLDMTRFFDQVTGGEQQVQPLAFR